MTIFYTIASAMLISSNVSATNNIQRLPSVTVQADSSVSKKASKFSLEGKLLGIKKKTIILSAVGIAAILAVVYIAKNRNKAKIIAKNRNKAEIIAKNKNKAEIIRDLLDGVCEDAFKNEEADAGKTSANLNNIFYTTTALKALLGVIAASGKDEDVVTALKSVKKDINVQLNALKPECDQYLIKLVEESELGELNNALTDVVEILDKDKSDLRAEVGKLKTLLDIIKDDLRKIEGKGEKVRSAALKRLRKEVNDLLNDIQRGCIREIDKKNAALQVTLDLS